jgi:hypothetical protein
MLIAFSAAHRAVSGLIVPYHSGGWGFWIGESVIGTSERLKWWPLYESVVLSMALRTISAASL